MNNNIYYIFVPSDHMMIQSPFSTALEVTTCDSCETLNLTGKVRIKIAIKYCDKMIRYRFLGRIHAYQKGNFWLSTSLIELTSNPIVVQNWFHLSE